MRKMKTNTGASDSDEADHSSHRRRFRAWKQAVVQANPNLRFSILKRGITGSSDIEWRGAQTCSAKAQVHIVGHHYGHPNPETLARSKATGAIIFRTDQDGQSGARFTQEN